MWFATSTEAPFWKVTKVQLPGWGFPLLSFLCTLLAVLLPGLDEWKESTPAVVPADLFKCHMCTLWCPSAEPPTPKQNEPKQSWWHSAEICRVFLSAGTVFDKITFNTEFTQRVEYIMRIISFPLYFISPLGEIKQALCVGSDQVCLLCQPQDCWISLWWKMLWKHRIEQW